MINSFTGNADILRRSAAALMPAYPVPPTAIVKGNGCYLWDADDNQYLDLIGGIAVSALGHAHPAVVAAISEQASILCHTSNLVANIPAIELAERLIDLFSPDSRVFLTNSGAEAVEAALKLAWLHAAGRRSTVVSVTNSFHGRTLGALALTGQESKRTPFKGLLPDVQFVPFGDAAALQAAITDDVAAVFIEPVQGEAGVIPVPEGYLAAARSACDRTGALLVFDEIQGGIGRTGSWFSYQILAAGITPDIVTVAKGLGGGLPIGACLARGAAATAFHPGVHGTTFGGNPVCCAAALAVLKTIEDDNILSAVRLRGSQLTEKLLGLQHPLIAQVRGLGLWRAIVLHKPVAIEVERAARNHGLLVNPVSSSVIRLAPPLILSESQVDEAVSGLAQALTNSNVKNP